ncbi:hypothetical protein JY446_16250 [Serratia marcescens]|nr:hypothetical protein [Serratia marcescens]
MTLTTERQQFEQWWHEEYCHLEGSSEAAFVKHVAWEAMQKARELLANREAQPVAWASTASLKRGDVREVWPNGEQHKAGKLCITALYTAPPAPAVVKLPTEFYSDEGIVVRLEEVMAALAVVGVQYERKANAKTRCEFPASEVPEEMTGGIAMSKYKVKKSNYAQWVKGWNACRAAMLAKPVSQRYTLPPHVFRELVNSLRDTAVKYQGTQQLREQLSRTLTDKGLSAAAQEGGNDHDAGR